MICRICETDCETELLNFPAPALVSTTAILDAPTIVYACQNCDHIQKPNFPEVERFYDQDYQISLESETHDQVYEFVDGTPVYRTDYQASLAIELLTIESGMFVLDFGCGKATTLKNIVNAVPDITPAVFDVSSSYSKHWKSWVSESEVATYQIPEFWTNRFDRVMAHFVLEHLTNPVQALKEIARVLKAGGKAFVTIPNVFTNPGDLLVVDHLNHFTSQSFLHAANNSGLILEAFHDTRYRGAFVAILKKPDVNTDVPKRQYNSDIKHNNSDIKHMAQSWISIRKKILAYANTSPKIEVAIYGAGFYGALIAMLVKDQQRVSYFIDRNPHLHDNSVFDIPIKNPDEISNLPDTLYVGLNPNTAHEIIESWLNANKHEPESVVFLKT